MAEYLVAINEIINQGLAWTLPCNEKYGFANNRAYPRMFVDDWLGVDYEGANLLDVRFQVQYPPGCHATGSTKF